VLGARVLAEFGDDKSRYADARARKNYAGTSPIIRESGKKKTVLARHTSRPTPLTGSVGRGSPRSAAWNRRSPSAC
jgi:hypothetical protein